MPNRIPEACYEQAKRIAHGIYPVECITVAQVLSDRAYRTKLVFDYDGTQAWSNVQDHTIHVGIRMIVDMWANDPVYPLIVNGVLQADRFIAAVEYILWHEMGHVLYTADRPFAMAIQFGAERIMCRIAKDYGIHAVIRSDRDRQNVLDSLARNAGIRLNLSFLTETMHFIVNSLEDGRMERCVAGDYPGFSNPRSLFRGCFWRATSGKSYEFGVDSPVRALNTRLDEVLSLATCGVLKKGFAMNCAGTPVYDEVMGYIPVITTAYIAPTASGACDGTLALADLMYPAIKDAVIAASMDNAAAEALEKMLRDLLTAMAQNETFGPPNSAKSNSSMNTPFGMSDLDITLPDDVYDKLMENAEISEDGTAGGIHVHREHPKEEKPEDKPKPEDKSGSESGSDSEGGSSENDEKSEKSGGGSGTGKPDDNGSDKNGNDSSDGASSDKKEDKPEEGSAGKAGQAESKQEDADKKASGNGAESNSESDVNAQSQAASDGRENSGEEPEQSETVGEKAELGHPEKGGHDNRKSAESISETMDDATSNAIDKAVRESAAKVTSSAKEIAESIHAVNVFSKAATKRIESGIKESADKQAVVSADDVSDIVGRYGFKEAIHPEYSRIFELRPEDKVRADRLYNAVSKFFLTKRKPSIRNKRSGILDTRRVDRLARNDVRVFMRNQGREPSDVAIYLLVDHSGSMCGAKLATAMTAAAVQEEAFKQFAALKIVGFTTVYGSIYHKRIKGWDEVHKWNCCWNWLMHDDDVEMGNEDGYDIMVATRELLQRREKNRILIVLSDGAPGDCKLVKKAVDNARAKGIKVAGIYFEEGSVSDRAVKTFGGMYTRDYVCTSVDKIDSELTKIMRKFALR